MKTNNGKTVFFKVKMYRNENGVAWLKGIKTQHHFFQISIIVLFIYKKLYRIGTSPNITVGTIVKFTPGVIYTFKRNIIINCVHLTWNSNHFESPKYNM